MMFTLLIVFLYLFHHSSSDFTHLSKPPDYLLRSPPPLLEEENHQQQPQQLQSMTSNSPIVYPIGFPADQYTSLYNLYVATHGDYWTWQETSPTSIIWNFTSPSYNNPCLNFWEGIICLYVVNETTGAILNYTMVYLSLPNTNLTGTLPNNVFLPFNTSLTTLQLSGNALKGSLPQSLYSLQSLKYLSLQSNLFSSSLSPNFCQLTNLLSVSLEENFFSSTLPTCLGFNLTKLTGLALNNNYFNGSLPNSFYNLKFLQGFSSGNNFFTGTISSQLSTMAALIKFSMGNNQLYGTIPSNCFPSKIQTIDISKNLLTGTLPISLGNPSLKSLKTLALAGNSLHGTLPLTFLGNITKVSQLGLGVNFFNGNIHESFLMFKFSKMFVIQLLSNLFTGFLPLVNAPNMQFYEVRNNYFTGSIPEGVLNITYQVILDVSDNYLSGTVSFPSSGGNYPSYINLSSNHLTGSLTNLFNLS